MQLDTGKELYGQTNTLFFANAYIPITIVGIWTEVNGMIKVLYVYRYNIHLSVNYCTKFMSKLNKVRNFFIYHFFSVDTFMLTKKKKGKKKKQMPKKLLFLSTFYIKVYFNNRQYFCSVSIASSSFVFLLDLALFFFS